MLRKIKSKLTNNEYEHLYPSGASPGELYDIAKIHKLYNDNNVQKLSIRPIIYNTGTVT